MRKENSIRENHKRVSEIRQNMIKEAEIIMIIIVRTGGETIVIIITKRNILGMTIGILIKTNKITITTIENQTGTTMKTEISNTNKEIVIITMIEEGTNTEITRIAIRRLRNTKPRRQSKGRSKLR